MGMPLMGDNPLWVFVVSCKAEALTLFWTIIIRMFVKQILLEDLSPEPRAGLFLVHYDKDDFWGKSGRVHYKILGFPKFGVSQMWYKPLCTQDLLGLPVSFQILGPKGTAVRLQLLLFAVSWAMKSFVSDLGDARLPPVPMKQANWLACMLGKNIRPFRVLTSLLQVCFLVPKMSSPNGHLRQASVGTQ